MQNVVSLSEFVVGLAWFVMAGCAVYAAIILLYRGVKALRGIRQRNIARERITRDLAHHITSTPTPLKNRALEAANRPSKPK